MKENSKKKEKQINIKDRINNFFEMPKEIVKNLPLITIVGNEEITIENYKGVIEYTQTKIRINTTCGILKLEGKNLFLKQITLESIVITGIVTHFEYLL